MGTSESFMHHPSNDRCWPKALVPFKVMNDCYPKAVVHVQLGYSRLVPRLCLMADKFAQNHSRASLTVLYQYRYFPDHNYNPQDFRHNH